MRKVCILALACSLFFVGGARADKYDDAVAAYATAASDLSAAYSYHDTISSYQSDAKDYWTKKGYRGPTNSPKIYNYNEDCTSLLESGYYWIAAYGDVYRNTQAFDCWYDYDVAVKNLDEQGASDALDGVIYWSGKSSYYTAVGVTSVDYAASDVDSMIYWIDQPYN